MPLPSSPVLAMSTPSRSKSKVRFKSTVWDCGCGRVGVYSVFRCNALSRPNDEITTHETSLSTCRWTPSKPGPRSVWFAYHSVLAARSSILPIAPAGHTPKKVVSGLAPPKKVWQQPPRLRRTAAAAAAVDAITETTNRFTVNTDAAGAGPLKLDDVDGNVYSCKRCGTLLAVADDIVSKVRRVVFSRFL